MCAEAHAAATATPSAASSDSLRKRSHPATTNSKNNRKAEMATTQTIAFPVSTGSRKYTTTTPTTIATTSTPAIGRQGGARSRSGSSGAGGVARVATGQWVGVTPTPGGGGGVSSPAAATTSCTKTGPEGLPPATVGLYSQGAVAGSATAAPFTRTGTAGRAFRAAGGGASTSRLSSLASPAAAGGASSLLASDAASPGDTGYSPSPSITGSCPPPASISSSPAPSCSPAFGGAAAAANITRPSAAATAAGAGAGAGAGGGAVGRRLGESSASLQRQQQQRQQQPGSTVAVTPTTQIGKTALRDDHGSDNQIEAKEVVVGAATPVAASTTHLLRDPAQDVAVASSSPSSQIIADERSSRDIQQWTLDLAPAMLGHTDTPKMLFIFINPTSGGNKAAAFTESGVCRMTLTTPFFCNMYIFDIREGKTGEKPGFILLKAATELLDNRNRASTTGNHSEAGAASTHAALTTLSPQQKQQQQRDRMPLLLQQGGGGAGAGAAGGQSQQQQKLDEEGSVANNNNRNNNRSSSDHCENGEASSTTPNTPPGADVIRVLVAGGDGTVMWVAMEAEAHHIDLEKIAVGVIPYGTGNDFATAFGWKQIRGLRPFDVAMRTMRSLMVRWSDAQVVRHDLWSIFIALCEDGCFTRINSCSRKKETLRDETGETRRAMSLIMSNYFSIGVESRIGRGFDRHRGRSRIYNKLTYGVEGFKVACFKRTASIEQLIDVLYEKPGEPEEEVIFRTRGSQVPHGPYLKRAMSLVLCNIPSFGAGNDIWGRSHTVGFVVKKHGSSQWGERAAEVKKEQQRTGDRELEFLTFPSAASLGLEFACHGRARRLHQGPGPWKITFKDLPLSAKVYFQVDGEFFQMHRPLHVMVKHSRTVKVLASRFDRHLHAR